MSLSQAEKVTRTLVEDIYHSLAVKPAANQAVILEKALDLFYATFLPKLRNLQEGESLQLTLRVDIIGHDGRVRGGKNALRNMPEYIAWRTSVFARDHYQCQECGKRGKLNAHHIQSWEHYPALRFDLANGPTLCITCHAAKHPHLRLLQKKHDESRG